MSGKKKTPDGAPKAKPVDLTRSSLPIGPENPGGARRPAGNAFWFKLGELTPRRSRELAKWEMVIMPKLIELATARQIIDATTGEVLAQDDALPGIPVGLTVEDSSAILDLNTAAAWAYLKSWTLTYPGSGQPVPLPETADDLLDLDMELYEALIEHAAKIQQAKIDFQVKNGSDEFGPDGRDDENSPTGA